MFLNRLQLKNFRNYDELDITFNSKKALIIGKNAQGKTNILEAIRFLSCLQSCRTKSDSELIMWNKDTASLKAAISKDNLQTDLELILSPPKKKILKVDGVNKSKLSEFTMHLSLVNFSFSDLLLLKGMPDDRRSWLDEAISQLYPAYSERMAKYNRIRLQKNNYLKKTAANSNADKELLEVWNNQLVTTGSNIIYLRQKFLKELHKPINLKHTEISETEKLSVKYFSTVTDTYNANDDDLMSVEKIAELFKQKIEERTSEEIIRMQSLVGPHRDDILFFINGMDAKKFASQGQQRTIVLSLKLAELELIKQLHNEPPILLLDDVLAELDDLRQNYLLSAIEKDTQTIITSVDTLHFNESYLKDVEIFKISQGKIVN